MRYRQIMSIALFRSIKLMADISSQIGIQTPPSEEVLIGLSLDLQNSIKNLKLENIDSYFGNNNLVRFERD